MIPTEVLLLPLQVSALTLFNTSALSTPNRPFFGPFFELLHHQIPLPLHFSPSSPGDSRIPCHSIETP